MTGPIIPAGQWPEWADRHCWDEDGSGWFYAPARARAFEWYPEMRRSEIPMPDGWDWRVPVLRPVTLAGSVPKPVAVIPTGHPTSVVQWLGPMPPQGTYLYTAPQQSPAIDLEQGLRDLHDAYVRLLESGRDRIMSFGGYCDPVGVMEQNDTDLLKVRELLALIDAHKGE